LIKILIGGSITTQTVSLLERTPIMFPSTKKLINAINSNSLDQYAVSDQSHRDTLSSPISKKKHFSYHYNLPIIPFPYDINSFSSINDFSLLLNCSSSLIKRALRHLHLLPIALSFYSPTKYYRPLYSSSIALPLIKNFLSLLP
jgi:hypothetical protein